MNQPYQAYQTNAVQTASGGELTLMLYNGCIRFIKQAEKAIEDDNFEQKNTSIQKAQNIIQELMVTLDPEVELSKQMLPLYDYIYHLLTETNIHNNLESLTEALDLVTEFRDTWKEALLKSRQEKHAKGSHV